VNLAHRSLGALALAACLAAGCGYTTASLYRTDVHSVAVPIFASREYRRELEFDLTRQITKTIETRTPYKVVHDRSRADTELRGEILQLQTPVISEDLDTAQPIDIQVTLICWFEWKDLRTGEILAASKQISASGTAARAVGENLDSATSDATRRLAELIVEAMEKEW